VARGLRLGTPVPGRHTRPVASRLPLIAILAAAFAAAVLWSPWQAAEAPATTPAAQRGTAPPAATVVPGRASAAVAAPAAPATDGVPPGLTAEQWARVEAGLASHPQPAAERARLRGYFVWSDAVQRWRGARHDAALARLVDAGLPARLANAEVSAAEARALKAALLQTLLPDPADHLAALQAFDATLPQPAGPSAQEREFLQRQTAIVAAWQAQPAAQRDPAALQRQLDALGRAHFQKETTR
jgi:hypothetical protein